MERLLILVWDIEGWWLEVVGSGFPFAYRAISVGFDEPPGIFFFLSSYFFFVVICLHSKVYGEGYILDIEHLIQHLVWGFHFCVYDYLALCYTKESSLFVQSTKSDTAKSCGWEHASICGDATFPTPKMLIVLLLARLRHPFLFSLSHHHPCRIVT